jgi:large subunit ribosomal protein L20
MVRVKRSKAKRARKKAMIKMAKGYKWGRNTKYVAAKQAVYKALSYAYRDRRVRKRSFRSLWQIRINAGVRQHGLTYSKFINALKVKKIEIDRKILSHLAENYPVIFEKVVAKAKE